MHQLLTIFAKNEKQYIDMVEFVVKPHEFDNSVNKPMMQLLEDVTMLSKSKKLIEKGKELKKMRSK